MENANTVYSISCRKLRFVFALVKNKLRFASVHISHIISLFLKTPKLEEWMSVASVIDFAPHAVNELSWVVNLERERKRLCGALRQVGTPGYWPNFTTLEVTEWQLAPFKVRTVQKIKMSGHSPSLESTLEDMCGRDVSGRSPRLEVSEW
jgi:hypothetical protein